MVIPQKGYVFIQHLLNYVLEMTRPTVSGVEVPECGTNDKPTTNQSNQPSKRLHSIKRGPKAAICLFGQHLPMSGLRSRRLGGVSCPRAPNKLRVYLHTHRMVNGTTSLITPETQWTLAITVKTVSHFWFIFWPGPRSGSGWVSPSSGPRFVSLGDCPVSLLTSKKQRSPSNMHVGNCVEEKSKRMLRLRRRHLGVSFVGNIWICGAVLLQCVPEEPMK